MRVRWSWQSFIMHAGAPWAVWLAVSVIIVSTAIQSFREIDEQFTDLVLTRREAIAQLTAVHLAEKFKNVEDVAVSLATRVRFRDLVAAGRWQDAIDIMRDVPGDLPIIERLLLADAAGTLRADIPAMPGVRGADLAYREWYQGLSAGRQTHVSSVFTRLVEPQLRVFTVSTWVRNAAGEIAGILVIQMRDEVLLDWIEVVDIGPDGFIYVVDARGQLAFHSKHPDRKDIVDLSKLAVVGKLQRGERGVEIGFDPQEGEDSIVAFASTPRYAWGVIVQQPVRSSGLAARDAQLWRLAVGYGVTLLLCAVAMYLVARIVRVRRRAEEDRQSKLELERHVVERTAQLAAANKELEAFSYSVSHDLRAPLRAIDGFSRIVIEDHGTHLGTEAIDYLGRVRTAAQRMGTQIDDLLELSRVGRAEMRRTDVDLSRLAHAVVEQLRVGEPGRLVDVTIAPALVGHGDERLLRLVLENLLGNAWKYTRLTAAARIDFSATPGEGETVYCVRDNGAGFDMTYVDKLFRPFQRLHRAEEFEGTGVGLAIVARVMARHGGRVWGQGDPGKGATFCFTLPRAVGARPGITDVTGVG